ncbi:hypothetical protein ACI65C_009996 [Semiaphis heraclei]
MFFDGVYVGRLTFLQCRVVVLCSLPFATRLFYDTDILCLKHFISVQTLIILEDPPYSVIRHVGDRNQAPADRCPLPCSSQQY